MWMEPMRFVKGWRFLQIVVLTHVWMIHESSTRSFILILLLLVMACLRWRFDMPVGFVVLDIFLCCLFAPFTHLAYYGAALPMFELALKGKWTYSLLIFSVSFFFPASSSLWFWYQAQAFFFGSFSWMTLQTQTKYKQEADELRQTRNELERIQSDLLEAQKSTSHQAEILERYRISRELHDHLGHDLTGAALALQAYEHVKEPHKAQALLQEVKRRIERSAKNLRETVHNMTPTKLIGIESLEHIAQHFGQMDIRFQKSGEMRFVPAHGWALLEACLKEALTNAARHSNATRVEADLHVSDSIVRLGIGDNGTVTKHGRAGSGLRGLQLRARALGGSLSIRSDNGFSIVCVIPVQKEDTDESAARR